MSWQTQLKGDSVSWLLEKDDPGVRYLALRDLKDLSGDDRELRVARKAAHQQGPIAAVLDGMNDEGYWAKAGPGYSPKYHGTVWSIILLAQLGAAATEDKRIARACTYLLDNNLAEAGSSPHRQPPRHGRLLAGQHVLGAARTGLRRSALDEGY